VKPWLLLSLVLFLSWFGLAVYAVERKPPVMINFVNGTEQRYRLDHVDENRVIVLKAGFQRKLVFSRSEIISMRFRPEIPVKLPEGEEGVILADGSILKGSPVWMDEKTFWIGLEDQKRKRVELKKVTFIQFANSKDAMRISAASRNSITSRVNVSAAKNWTNSSLTVKKGQQIWFTVGDYTDCNCGNSLQAATVDGIPNSANASSPVPSANLCSLIGKIGEEGKPFEVGLRKTAVIAEESGNLYLGVNDSSLKDNTGKFDVFVKVTISDERSESSRISAPEEENASRHR